MRLRGCKKNIILLSLCLKQALHSIDVCLRFSPQITRVTSKQYSLYRKAIMPNCNQMNTPIVRMIRSKFAEKQHFV